MTTTNTNNPVNNPSNNNVRKRLFLVLLLIVGVAATAGLALSALSSNIDFFYTPRDVINGKNGVIPRIGQRMQVGGMVLPGSVKRSEDSLAIEFIVYDNTAQLTVRYTGVLPDLFAEEQSVVVKGVLAENNVIEADTILAKHDENYTPPEVEEAMRENHSSLPGSGATPQGGSL